MSKRSARKRSLCRGRAQRIEKAVNRCGLSKTGRGPVHNEVDRGVVAVSNLMIPLCSYDNQRHRAAGLNLLTAAITLWNTVYLDHAITTTGHPTDDPLLDHLSPLGWEHINLTGDYTWNNPRQPKAGKLRPLHRPGNS